METGEKIIIALVVVVTFGVIGGAANSHEMLKAWQKA